jgi:hypothetical protein
MDTLFGKVEPPPGVTAFQGGSGQAPGLIILIQNIARMLVIGAGIFALFNFIFAGYAFLSAGDDPKKVESAWQKIYLSILGLAIAGGSFLIAAIFGQLLFGDYSAILRPQVFTP